VQSAINNSFPEVTESKGSKMRTQIERDYWATQAGAECVTELLSAAASETTLYGQMVLGFQGFIKAPGLLDDIYDV
jgi:hypothetical protein